MRGEGTILYFIPQSSYLIPHTSYLTQQLLCHRSEAVVLLHGAAAAWPNRYIFFGRDSEYRKQRCSRMFRCGWCCRIWCWTIIVMWVTKKRLF